jgi:hypothetical protein
MNQCGVEAGAEPVIEMPSNFEALNSDDACPFIYLKNNIFDPHVN